jgi:hypothetical protein
MPQLPTLYAKGSKAKDINVWTVRHEGKTVFFEYGQLDGRLQTSHYDAAATNVGRANQRDPIAQAAFEAKSAFEKKIKSGGYYPDIEAARNAQIILPMLAHRYDKQGKKITWGRVSLQYKFNGLRTLVVCNEPGEVQLISRGNERWELPHIAAACAAVMNPGDMLDGEIYISNVSLQTIASLAKRYRPESLALRLFLYDMPQKAGKLAEWKQRADNLRDLFEEKIAKTNVSLATGFVSKTLCLAKTVDVKNVEEAKIFEREAISLGMEGVILRNWGGEYRFNYRSYDVQKWKNFADAEYKVLDAKSRVYVNSGTGEKTTIVDVFVCRNNLNDRTFEVVPRGDTATKAEYWTNRQKYIGERIMVRYLELSEDLIPVGNPVGLGFRLNEDTAPEEPDMFANE